jgi:hypothetical protein
MYGGNDNTLLGTVYDIPRGDSDINNVKMSRPFGMATVQAEWRAFDFQFIGETEMTLELIEQEGRLSQINANALIKLRVYSRSGLIIAFLKTIAKISSSSSLKLSALV